MRYRPTWVFWAICLMSMMIGAAGPPASPGATSQPTDTPDAPDSPTPTPPNGSNPAIQLPTGANIAVVKIEGFIYGYTLDSLQRRVDHAIQQGASVVVIELDTPGGLVHSALKISKYIKSMPVRSVAWVNNQALSAGILIASACDQIVMAPASLTGDCAPIVPGRDLAPTERAKALSPILEEFRDSAQRGGYDYALFQAMCVLGVELYEIRHPQTGVTLIVNQADHAVMVQGKAVTGGWLSQMVGAAAAKVTPVDVGGASISVATEADRGQWRLVRQVHDGKTLLTVNQTRAFEMGLSKNDPKTDAIATEADLQRFLGAASTTTIKPSRIAMFAYWLTTPWVRGILIVVMLVGGYLELQAPGLGIAGATALLALVLLLVAPYLIGLAQIWHVLLLLLGLVLLGVEIFVIPGMGVSGVAGVVCIFIGLILMAVPSSGQGLFPMPAHEMAEYLRLSALWAVLAVIASGIGFYYLTRYFGQVPVLNKLILTRESGSAGGPTHAPLPHVSGDEVLGSGRITVGMTGVTGSGLRPSGEMTIDGRVIDVVSLGDWIDPGQRVRVVEIQGNRIVVDSDQES